MRRYWVSWYDQLHGKWELHSPWWVTGERLADGALTICAAIRASDEDDAKRLIIMAHDEPRPRDVEWRFVDPQSDDWVPYSDRFPQADWMQWPLAAEPGVFVHATPTCDHDFQGWREVDGGRGGEAVCTKCGMGAMAWSLRTWA